jgi:hypothetical protein
VIQIADREKGEKEGRKLYQHGSYLLTWRKRFFLSFWPREIRFAKTKKSRKDAEVSK